jgi:hypothetical protein
MNYLSDEYLIIFDLDKLNINLLFIQILLLKLTQFPLSYKHIIK